PGPPPPPPHSSPTRRSSDLVARAADAIANGEHPFDNWLPDLELGFPVFLYYQQIPHLAVVALDWLTLGTVQLRTMFDLVRYALLDRKSTRLNSTPISRMPSS